MEDAGIVSLYWDRSEQAIVETDRKYGAYCFSISYNILTNREDAQECVSDTYMAAWRAMPPKKPGILSAFLGKITRCISLDRWKSRSAYKRGGGEVMLALEELEDCLSGGETPEEALLRRETVKELNRFLEALPKIERQVFLCRYWYLDSVKDIAQRFGFTEGKVTSMLHRTRKKLGKCLEKEVPV